jgi:acylphosphatase
MKRVHVVFSGRVQGVGFRYSVCRIAAEYKVTGFVRNLLDGDVELIAEGEQQELFDFLHAIRNSQVGSNILKDRIGWKKSTHEFDRFGISF